jgi:hypothetical protein
MPVHRLGFPGTHHHLPLPEIDPAILDDSGKPYDRMGAGGGDRRAAGCRAIL